MSVAHVQDGALVSTMDLLRVLDRLPAELRAKVRWVRPVARAAIAELRSGALTPERIDTAARALTKPMLEVASVLFAHMSRDEVHALLSEASESLRADGITGLDADSIDTLDWCVAILDAVRRHMAPFISHLDTSSVAAPAEEQLGLALAHPFLGPLLRGQTLMLAAVLDSEHAPEPEDIETSAELISAAYLELCGALDALRVHGVVIEPFSEDTHSGRARRALRAATALRETLSDEDANELFSARLRALR